MTTKIEVRVRRVSGDREPDDGVRVLVDRVWPRGLTKERADLDEWCKAVAPSTSLRTWYGHDPERFEEFGRRYRSELDEPERAEVLQHLRELARYRTVTLLTGTTDAEISQAGGGSSQTSPQRSSTFVTDHAVPWVGARKVEYFLPVTRLKER